MDGEHAAARCKTSQRFYLHDSRILGEAEGRAGQHSFGAVDVDSQLGHCARSVGSCCCAQEAGPGGVAAVDQTGKFVQIGRDVAAHVQVVAGDGQQRSAALWSESREDAVQLQVLSIHGQSRK